MTDENTKIPTPVQMPEKRTVITIFDGDEPGMTAMAIQHFPESAAGSEPNEVRLHMIVGTAVARLWDLQVIQRLTGSLCQDMIQMFNQQEHQKHQQQQQTDLTETDKSV